ncbi:MAG: hypothetical protein ACT4PY_00375 [Armatimonadota bacterium]
MFALGLLACAIPTEEREEHQQIRDAAILIGPGQLERLIEDLQAAQTCPDTSTVALVLSTQTISVRNATLTFPPEARLYVGPIQTLGFRGSLQEIQRQLHGLDEIN